MSSNVWNRGLLRLVLFSVVATEPEDVAIGCGGFEQAAPGFIGVLLL